MRNNFLESYSDVVRSMWDELWDGTRWGSGFSLSAGGGKTLPT